MPYLSSPARNYHNCYWGLPTSSANFCEQDYTVTPYVAEFVNTVSNVAYITLAIYGYRRRPQSSILPWIALSLVGVLSGLYHASMLMHWQWGDMLSMHIGAGVVLQRIYTRNLDATATTRFNVALVSFIGVIVLLRQLTGSDLFHDMAFGVVVMASSVTTRRAIKADPVEGFRVKARRQAYTGTALGATAYALWLVDVFLCDRLRGMREVVGLPWAWILELHGWWHVLTALAVYYYIDLVEDIRERGDTAAAGVGGRGGKKTM